MLLCNCHSSFEVGCNVVCAGKPAFPAKQLKMGKQNLGKSKSPQNCCILSQNNTVLNIRNTSLEKKMSTSNIFGIQVANLSHSQILQKFMQNLNRYIKRVRLHFLFFYLFQSDTSDFLISQIEIGDKTKTCPFARPCFTNENRELCGLLSIPFLPSQGVVVCMPV